MKLKQSIPSSPPTEVNDDVPSLIPLISPTQVLWSRGCLAKGPMETMLIKGRNLYKVC